MRVTKAEEKRLPDLDTFDALVDRVRGEISTLVVALLENRFAPVEVEEALSRALRRLGALDEFVRS